MEISQKIKEIKASHEDYEDKIEEIKKKLLDETKEKALLKLEKDKLQKKAHAVQTTISEGQKKVERDIEAQHKRQRNNMSPSAAADQSQLLGQSTLGRGTAKNTRMPEDARPNPFLSQVYEPLPSRLTGAAQIPAHTRGIGGMALH